jgi:uncharacterized protein
MVTKNTVEFRSEELRCEADLYLPEGFAGEGLHPALVLGHGLTVARSSLKEEGRLFAEAGYVALAIDYRHFGGSAGEPRHDLSPSREVEDIRSALDWLEAQSGVDPDRLGIWGTSFGGGIVTQAAAFDVRVKACVAQAPILDGDCWLRTLNRESEYLAIRSYLLDARRRRASVAPGAPEPRVPLGQPAADGFLPLPPDPIMIEDVQSWYARTGEQLMDSAPDTTLATWERVLQFDVIRYAAKIAPRAYCIVQLTGRDVYHPRGPMEEAFRIAGEPKEMVPIPIAQLDCYKPEGRAQTIQAAIRFFDRHLR